MLTNGSTKYVAFVVGETQLFLNGEPLGSNASLISKSCWQDTSLLVHSFFVLRLARALTYINVIQLEASLGKRSSDRLNRSDA